MTSSAKLVKLADFLEHQVKPSWFDLETWCSPGFKKRECGSTACALGWATVCFPRSGLHWTTEKQIALHVNDDHDYFNFSAAMKFFDLDEDTAQYLFQPDRYPFRRGGRLAVVRRLRRVAMRMATR